MSFAIDNAPSPGVNYQLLKTFNQQKLYTTRTHDTLGSSLISEISQAFGAEKDHLKTLAGGNDAFAQYNGLVVSCYEILHLECTLIC